MHTLQTPKAMQKQFFKNITVSFQQEKKTKPKKPNNNK